MTSDTPATAVDGALARIDRSLRAAEHGQPPPYDDSQVLGAVQVVKQELAAARAQVEQALAALAASTPCTTTSGADPMQEPHRPPSQTAEGVGCLNTLHPADDEADLLDLAGDVQRDLVREALERGFRRGAGFPSEEDR